MFKNLAKPDETIVDHTKSCLGIAFQLYSAYEKEISQRLSFEDYTGKEIFFLTVILHDLGKYATPFQEKTLAEGKGYWPYRHEILSAEFTFLLDAMEPKARELIIYAILSHHNKTIKQLEKATFNASPQPFLIGIPAAVTDAMHETRKKAYETGKESILNHVDSIFGELREMVSFSGIPSKINYTPEKIRDTFREIEWYYQHIGTLEADFDYDALIFLKGLLVTADHLGSAHERIKNVDTDIEEFYKARFEIPEKGSFRTTQIKCLRASGRSVVLKAPTGTGKTEAAFLWTNENLKTNRYSRIFYILPYTASINAMHERLNTTPFAKGKVELLHGKNKSYYYNLLTKDRPDSEIEENIDTINKEIRLKKLSAKNFSKPVKIVTPHQIIKNFYGLKHFEEAFLQYQNGLFILDEIHCYDTLFLGEFLAVMKMIKDHFNGSFLFMSATLPIILEDLIKKAMDIPHDTICFEDEELHAFTKTRLRMIDGRMEQEENLHFIQHDINQGKRVLVVCNTIQKAQQIYDKLQCGNKEILHSAFNITDRNRIENKIINLENSDRQVQVLVGTQAIEVSLDLDYDCCYSELAAIDALIQRFGRVFRNRDREKDEYGDVHVFIEADKATQFIYNEEIEDETYDVLGLTLSFLKTVDGFPLDYKTICTGVDQVYNTDYKRSVLNAYNHSSDSIKRRILRPMGDYQEEARLYYEQFDGIKILPSSLTGQYEIYIDAKRYIDADNLLVTLTERKLFSYYQKNYVYQMPVKGKNIFIADDDILGYSEEKGLFLKDPSDHNFI